MWTRSLTAGVSCLSSATKGAGLCEDPPLAPAMGHACLCSHGWGSNEATRVREHGVIV